MVSPDTTKSNISSGLSLFNKSQKAFGNFRFANPVPPEEQNQILLNAQVLEKKPYISSKFINFILVQLIKKTTNKKLFLQVPQRTQNIVGVSSFGVL